MLSSCHQCYMSVDLIDNESFLIIDNIFVFLLRFLYQGHSGGEDVGVGGFIIYLGLLLPHAFLNYNWIVRFIYGKLKILPRG